MPDGWRRGLWLLPLCYAAVLFLWPPADPSVEVLGDGAAEIRAALGTPGAALPVTALSLRRRENLRHVPDIERLCRGACDAALTVLRVAGFRRGAKVLVFDLAAFGGADALDLGQNLPEPVAACLARAVTAEATHAWTARPPPCLPSRRVLWRLPGGF